MINRPDIKVIKTIYEKLPVYERLLDNMELEINEIAEFCNLPIIKRKNLIEQQSGFIMPEYVAKYMKNNLKELRTSGSTGQYLDIYWNIQLR